MSKSELIGMIRDVDAQYAALFGEVIAINFAMIAAIYYFLRRSALLFRMVAFGFYAIGILALGGGMRRQAEFSDQARAALAAAAPGQRSPIATKVLTLDQSWWFQASTFFNVGIWVLAAVIAYLLFGGSVANRWQAARTGLTRGDGAPVIDIQQPGPAANFRGEEQLRPL